MMARSTKKRIDWDAVKATLRAAETALEQSLSDDDASIQDIFRKRAHQLAADNLRVQPAAATVPILIFKIGNETYGVELRSVAQVFPDTRITPVPGSPNHLLGVANLQGEVRSVFSLRRLLALPENNEGTNRYILLLRDESRRLGLQVEQIEGVRQIVMEELIEGESAATEKCQGYLHGMTQDKVMILRIQKLFNW